MNELEILARNLKRLRAFAGMTQAELGLRVEFTKDTISKIELGKQENIGLRHLILICNEFGIRMKELFAEDDKEIPITLKVSDESVDALGKIFERFQKILTKSKE